MNLLSLPGLKYYFWVGVFLIIIFTFLEPAGAQPVQPHPGDRHRLHGALQRGPQRAGLSRGRDVQRRDAG